MAPPSAIAVSVWSAARQRAGALGELVGLALDQLQQAGAARCGSRPRLTRRSPGDVRRACSRAAPFELEGAGHLDAAAGVGGASSKAATVAASPRARGGRRRPSRSLRVAKLVEVARLSSSPRTPAPRGSTCSRTRAPTRRQGRWRAAARAARRAAPRRCRSPYRCPVAICSGVSGHAPRFSPSPACSLAEILKDLLITDLSRPAYGAPHALRHAACHRPRRASRSPPSLQRGAPPTPPHCDDARRRHRQRDRRHPGGRRSRRPARRRSGRRRRPGSCRRASSWRGATESFNQRY